MVTTLFTGISELTTNVPERGRIVDAGILIEDDRVLWTGRADQAPAGDLTADLGGRAVLPGWVDSHTHLMFAGDRSHEFEERMAGRPYAAGGIAETMRATREAGLEQLVANALRLRREAERGGTTYLETKTGYGLDIATETRSAVAAAAVADVVTFLGAHLVPPGADRREYLDLVTGPMLAAVAPYVEYIDVFCEEGAFDIDESREVLLAGRAAGLGLRVHGNQLGRSGGVALALEVDAASVDHCNHLSRDDIEALAASSTIATFLPACDLSTRQPFGPARQLLDQGGTIAIASNCNPGTSYTTSMSFCVSTAVLQMGLTVEEAVFAATRGSALALGVSDAGILEPGARADLHVLDAPTVGHLAYRPGVPLTHEVWRGGVKVVGGVADRRGRPQPRAATSCWMDD